VKLPPIARERVRSFIREQMVKIKVERALFAAQLRRMVRHVDLAGMA
jgi:hypothetical protein